MIKRMFGLAVFAVVLTAVLSATPVFAGEIPTAPALAAPAAGGCGQAALVLSVKGETCSAVIAPLTARPGYCHCGCSSVRTCHTSADCGGASCDQTPSCC